MGDGNYQHGYLPGENAINNLHVKLFMRGRFGATHMTRLYPWEPNIVNELAAIQTKKIAVNAL